MYQTQVFKGFNGLNDSTALDSLLPTELTIAENVVFDNRGGYTKGWGRVRHTASPIDPNPVKTIFPLYKKDGSTVKFYTAGTKLFKDNGNGTYTELTNTLTSPKLDYFSWVDDKVYFLDGTNYCRTNGTTVETVPAGSSTDLSGVNRCSMHEFYPAWFRHFFAGDSQDRSALWYSVDSDPTKVNSGPTGIDKVYPVTNLGPITGLKIWRDSLLVGYKRGWMLWYGGGVNPAITANWKQVKASSGPVSNRSIVVARERLVYAADDGIYSLESLNQDTDDNSVKISKDISGFYKKLVNKDNMAAVFDGRWLYISACDGTVGYNNIVLVADFDLIDEEGQPAWSVFTQCHANDFLYLDGTTYFAHSNNGLVMKFSQTSWDNDDQALGMKVEHYFTLPDRTGQLNPFALHKIKTVLVAMNQSSMNASCKVTVDCDYQDSKFQVELSESFKWGEDDWGEFWGSDEMIAKEIKISNKARRIRITIENDVLGESLSIHALGVKYRPGKTKGVSDGITNL